MWLIQPLADLRTAPTVGTGTPRQVPQVMAVEKIREVPKVQWCHDSAAVGVKGGCRGTVMGTPHGGFWMLMMASWWWKFLLTSFLVVADGFEWLYL